jgi:hypothetical protein
LNSLKQQIETLQNLIEFGILLICFLCHSL